MVIDTEMFREVLGWLKVHLEWNENHFQLSHLNIQINVLSSGQQNWENAQLIQQLI